MDPSPIDRKRADMSAMLRFLIAIAMILLVALVTARPLEPEQKAPYKLFLPFVPSGLSPALTASLHRTALVYAEVEPGQFAVGSAFVLQDGLVATAAHVATAAAGHPITVFCNGDETSGIPLRIDEDRDVALIVAFCAEGPLPLRYALAPLDVDQQLIMAGFTFVNEDADEAAEMVGLQYAQQTSPIPGARLDRFTENAEIDPTVKQVIDGMARVNAAPLLAVSGSMRQGHSGSAVYDASGALVGMAIIIDFGRNRSFIVPAESILLNVVAEEKE